MKEKLLLLSICIISFVFFFKRQPHHYDQTQKNQKSQFVLTLVAAVLHSFVHLVCMQTNYDYIHYYDVQITIANLMVCVSFSVVVEEKNYFFCFI